MKLKTFHFKMKSVMALFVMPGYGMQASNIIVYKEGSKTYRILSELQINWKNDAYARNTLCD